MNQNALFCCCLSAFCLNEHFPECHEEHLHYQRRFESENTDQQTERDFACLILRRLQDANCLKQLLSRSFACDVTQIIVKKLIRKWSLRPTNKQSFLFVYHLVFLISVFLDQEYQYTTVKQTTRLTRGSSFSRRIACDNELQSQENFTPMGHTGPCQKSLQQSTRSTQQSTTYHIPSSSS